MYTFYKINIFKIHMNYYLYILLFFVVKCVINLLPLYTLYFFIKSKYFYKVSISKKIFLNINTK